MNERISKHKLLALMIFTLLFNVGYGQHFEKPTFNILKKHYYLEFDFDKVPVNLVTLLKNQNIDACIYNTDNKFVHIVTTNELDVEKSVGLQNNFKGLVDIYKVYLSNNIDTAYSNNELILELKPEYGHRDLEYYFKDFDLTNISELINGTYVIKFSNNENIIYLYDLASNTNLFKRIEINWLFKAKKKNINPNFISQWSLKNIGQTGGISGADVKAEQTWCISRGSGVIVAILDDGVDVDHPDLFSNMINRGFDATGNRNDGTPQTIDAHGTQCAGVVGMVNNSIGGLGIAYEAKILAIRIGYTTVSQSFMYTKSSWISIALFYAKNNADIISFSISLPSYIYYVTPDFVNAYYTGREGKGCLIAVASGNESTTINYPSWIPEVISVGATNHYDTRAGYSNYGTGLDIVAPGGDNSTLSSRIFTTDLSGTNGDSDDDFIRVTGTSYSTPLIAGIAALVLSVNPNLTSQQLRAILETTTDKVGPYSYNYNSNQPYGLWNSEMGYGRVNAFKALQTFFKIEGTFEISCQTPTTYKITKPVNATISWSVGPNINIISSNNDSIVVIGVNNPSSSSWIDATYNINNCTSFTQRFNFAHVGFPNAVNDIEGMENGSNFCEGEFIQLTAVTENHPLGMNFNWTVTGGNIVAGQGTNTIYVSASYIPNTYFEASVNSFTDCGSTLGYSEFGSVGCGGGVNFYSVNPNPVSNEQLTVHSNYTETKKEFEYEIRPLLNTLITKKGKATTGTPINITQLLPGAYLITIKDGKRIESIKFLISK